MSVRFLAFARLEAKSKLASTLRRAMSTILRLNAGSALAGSVERLLERRQRGIESILRAVIGLAALRDVLLGKGAHAFGDGGIETEMTELVGHVAIDGADLVGGKLGSLGRSHEKPLGVKAQANFRRLESRGSRA
jgi:hypothetical protein